MNLNPLVNNQNQPNEKQNYVKKEVNESSPQKQSLFSGLEFKKTDTMLESVQSQQSSLSNELDFKQPEVRTETITSKQASLFSGLALK